MNKKTMKKNINAPITVSAKKAYKAPQLKVLGRVSTLTLKGGSAADGFGTFA